MKNKRIIYLLGLLLVIICIQNIAAQRPNPVAFEVSQNKENAQDTSQVIYEKAGLKIGSKEYIDSMKAARLRYVDSMKAVRALELDSIRKERQRISDSTMMAQKRYTDSVTQALAVQRVNQKRISDSLKLAQQHKLDSLANAKKYRESKQYKDSVARVKQQRIDSIAAVRKARNDSMAAARIKAQDSIAAARKIYTDSLKTALDAQKVANKLVQDSIAAVRKLRTDSLTTAKAQREAEQKLKLKEKDKKTVAKVREKEQKKRDAYSNEFMRKKKWTFPRNVIHNTLTRYNYYFNADQKMDMAIDNMLKSANNNYEKLLPLFPFNPDVDSSKLAPDMDSIIRRSSVALQIYDPRSKWQDNLYLIVGQAYYYKGDYNNASAAFKYIVAEAEAQKKLAAQKTTKTTKTTKTKEVNDLAVAEKKGLFAHKSSKNDAMFWLARTLVQDKQPRLAQTVLNMLKSSKDYDEGLNGRMAVEQANIDLSTADNANATENLAIIYEDKKLPDWLRQRAAYLNGQLLQQAGKYDASDAAFDKVIALKPVMEMDFYARMNKVDNSLYAKNKDSKSMMAALSSMSKETKYQTFYDKIYFSKARLAEQSNDIDEAVKNYRKSIAVSTNNQVQKGMSFAALGNLYYNQNKYQDAKLAYDSATTFLTEANNPAYAIAVQRAASLDHIAQPANIVKTQDSLLHLASLSEKEQRAIIKKYLKDMEKRQSDSAFLANNKGANNNVAPVISLNMGNQNWYFANATNVQQGIYTFQQKWGMRTLKDNWNRSNNLAASTAGNSNNNDVEDATSSLPTEEELFARIPKTQAQKDSATASVKQALFELGKGYYKNMEDEAMALKTFDELDVRFPNSDNAAEVLYYRYLIALNQQQNAKADAYYNDLQAKYGQSTWASITKESRQPTATIGTIATANIENHYDDAYNLLMMRDYSAVLSKVAEAPTAFPSAYGSYAKKYNMLKASALAGSGAYQDADSMLTAFIATNPNDELTPMATALQVHVKKYMQDGQGQINPVTTLASNVVADATLAYTKNANALHYVMVSSPDNDPRLSGLRAGLDEYHRTKNPLRNLTVSMPQLSSSRSVVVVKEFSNAAAALKYANELKNVKPLFREYANANQYEIMVISNGNIIKLFTDKDWDAYRIFYQKNY